MLHDVIDPHRAASPPGRPHPCDGRCHLSRSTRWFDELLDQQPAVASTSFRCTSTVHRSPSEQTSCYTHAAGRWASCSRWPTTTNPFANQNVQKHPNLFNEASTSTGFAWQKYTIGTRHNKVGTIIFYHFVSQESKAKDEQARFQSGLRQLFIVICKSSCVA